MFFPSFLYVLPFPFIIIIFFFGKINQVTPIDVLKTRIATGTCPVDMPTCAKIIVQESGFVGLYAGCGSRMIGSGLFSAIGFTVFEACKRWLDVDNNTHHARNIRSRPSSPSPPHNNNNVHKEQRHFTSPQNKLDHALVDSQR